MVANATELEKLLLEQIRYGIEDGTFGGLPVKTLSWWSGNIDSFEDLDVADELMIDWSKKCWPTAPADLVDEDGYVHDDYMYEIIDECWSRFTDKLAKSGILVSNHDG